jgi:hypothetical protein
LHGNARERSGKTTPLQTVAFDDKRNKQECFVSSACYSFGHTVWAHSGRIIAVDADAVCVLETEDNDHYDLLGAGSATQIVVYHVGNGRIRSSDTLFHINATGKQDELSTRFREWLVKQPGGADPTIVRDNRLIFDGASAVHMLPWLERWKAMHGP